MGGDGDSRADFGVLQIIEKGVVVARQQDSFALTGDARAGVIHVGADALIQNFVGVTVVDRGVHVGAGQGDGGVAVAADRVGDGAERDALRLGGLLGCGAAVDDGGGVGQQILRLGILRRGEEPACQRQIRP